MAKISLTPIFEKALGISKISDKEQLKDLTKNLKNKKTSSEFEYSEDASLEEMLIATGQIKKD